MKKSKVKYITKQEMLDNLKGEQELVWAQIQNTQAEMAELESGLDKLYTRHATLDSAANNVKNLLDLDTLKCG